MSFIILDRDGVINYESEAYIKSPEEWLPIPGSLEAIAKLNQNGYKVFIATNQSGVGRGYYDLAMLSRIHEKLQHAVQAFGGKIEEIFVCPHHPNDRCLCRKPQAGLLRQIEKKYSISMHETYFIGDTKKDVDAAREVGCRPILVLTGYGSKTLEKYPELSAIPNFEDLREAVDYVLQLKEQHD